MNNFKNFNIKPSLTSFTGDKIKMDRILNTEIIVHGYDIKDSTVKAGTKLLTLQISRNETKHIVFTGSKVLQDMIQQVPKENFPFRTTIVRESERLEFT